VVLADQTAFDTDVAVLPAADQEARATDVDLVAGTCSVPVLQFSLEDEESDLHVNPFPRV
jgi:hypothetical protein